MKNRTLAILLSLPLVSCARVEEAVTSPKQDVTAVEMSTGAQKNIGLTVAPAGLTNLTEYLHVLGTVQPIDGRVGEVRSLARGRVLSVLASVGARVENGQPLARLDNIEAGDLAAERLVAHAELQRLKVQQASAAKQTERSKSLVSIGAVAQKEFDSAQAEYAALSEAVNAQERLLAGLEAKLRRFELPESDWGKAPITTIRSPFAGVVIRVHVAPGGVVDPDMELFAIADLSEVWVQAEVYEKDLGRVRVGQPAMISVETYSGETFSGKVAHISDTLDPKTRTAKVRCVVPNRDRRLKLDMFASVDVPTTVTRKVLAVPTAAIQDIDGKRVVFIRQSEQKFQIREVKVGHAARGQTEILAGLAENEPVVVEGAYHLKAVRLNKELGEG